MHNRVKRIPYTVVDITSPGYHSLLGRYFVGQSGELNFGTVYDAWCGLVNPMHSGVNLFFDIFTITNFSSINYTAEIWLQADLSKDAHISSTVTPSNQSITPPPKPQAYLKYMDYVTVPFTKGTNIFDRIVTENSTLVSDSHKGSIIIGPGGSISIRLKCSGEMLLTGTIVMTWWEEDVSFSDSRMQGGYL